MSSEDEYDRYIDEALRFEMRGDWDKALELYDAVAAMAPDRQEGKYAANCADRLRHREAVVEAASEKRIYSFGSLLMVGLDATLPATCMKCNAPTTSSRRITFERTRRVAYLIFPLVRFIPFGGRLLSMRVTMSVPVCALCDRRQVSREIKSGIIGAIIVLALAVLINVAVGNGLPPLSSDLAVPLVILSLVGFGLGFHYAPQMLKIERIQDRFALIRGAANEYVSNFPKHPTETEMHGINASG